MLPHSHQVWLPSALTELDTHGPLWAIEWHIWASNWYLCKRMRFSLTAFIKARSAPNWWWEMDQNRYRWVPLNSNVDNPNSCLIQNHTGTASCLHNAKWLTLFKVQFFQKHFTRCVYFGLSGPTCTTALQTTTVKCASMDTPKVGQPEESLLPVGWVTAGHFLEFCFF